MLGFRDGLELHRVYLGEGRHILGEFLLPVLSRACSYDRVTSYFTVDSLLAIANGLEGLFARGGSMRLVVGIHDFPREVAEAVVRTDAIKMAIDRVRSEFREGLMSLGDELLCRRMATVAWMIEDCLLEVRVACPTSGEGIFHPKTLIMRDEHGNVVAASGSINETKSGLGSNHEQLMVTTSWEDGEGTRAFEEQFQALWDDRWPDLRVLDLTRQLAEDIRRALDKRMPRRSSTVSASGVSLDGALARQMPSLFFVSGAIPALYHHQERAVIDALSRWPVRVLFADEVGLGKTFEVAATISFLMRYAGVKRAVILAPKSVMFQWQDELFVHFSLRAWVYDSAAGAYRDPEGLVRPADRFCPLGAYCPDITIFSAQFARGGRGRPSIFDVKGAQLPELLAVDEAHAARVSKDIGGGEKATRLYRTLEGVREKIPHMLLASATPMQKDPEEYYSMLRLLGLPAKWQSDKALRTADRLITLGGTPSVQDASRAVKLALDAWRSMKVGAPHLDFHDIAFLGRLEEATPPEASFIAQKEWKTVAEILLKVHPARLLTIRNTRSSLEKVGYQFPERRLHEVSLDGESEIEDFYESVEKYLGGSYFGVERVLYPDRRFSDGFVKSGYRQRLASSLYSCIESLKRRHTRLLELMDSGVFGGTMPSYLDESDSFDEDEALFADAGSFDGKADEGPALIDTEQLRYAAQLEIADLSQLIGRGECLLASRGDPKIDQALMCLARELSRGRAVLVFSRYTDTVATIVRACAYADGVAGIPFGVYTGDASEIRGRQGVNSVTKDELKSLLRRGDIRFVVCSDAASEGLNLQAASVLINVDVPWTPARLEQRIGRVARLGQRASAVDIYNVWYPHSVEAQMYRMIERRRHDYELSVGEFPELVAESIRDSVLGISEDRSIDLLKERRANIQEGALRLLWGRDDEGRTLTAAFREKLLELAGTAAQDATAEAGDAACISLSHDAFSKHPLVIPARLLSDGDGRPCALALGREGTSVLSPERILDAVLQGRGEGLCDGSRPAWLPDLGELRCLGVGDEMTPACPHLWPPSFFDNVERK